VITNRDTAKKVSELLLACSELLNDTVRIVKPSGFD
jgi:hypothetical protein